MQLAEAGSPPSGQGAVEAPGLDDNGITAAEEITPDEFSVWLAYSLEECRTNVRAG